MRLIYVLGLCSNTSLARNFVATMIFVLATIERILPLVAHKR